MKRLLRVHEVAGILDVSPARAYELIRRGVLPSVRLGERQLRVDEETLHEFIISGGTEPAGDLADGA